MLMPLRSARLAKRALSFSLASRAGRKRFVSTPCAATATLVTNVGKGGEQHYDVGNPHGCQCPGCTPLGFTIGDFDFRGDCSCCGHTPCGQYVFNVTNKNTGAEDGSVVKLRQGCADIFYKINKYSLTFPADATEEQKVQLIAAAIHSDFNYFEVRHD